MNRPKRSEHNREAILAEGIKLLSEQGYNGTGLKQILDTVKVPKGSFYHYFDSKETFAAEIIGLYGERLLSAFDSYVAQTNDSPVETIRVLYGLMANELESANCTQGCLVGNLAAEIGGKSEVCQRAMQKVYTNWQRRFEPLVEQAQEQGLMRQEVNAAQITELFWCAWEGAILRMKVTGNIEVLKNVMSVMLDSLLQPQQ